MFVFTETFVFLIELCNKSILLIAEGKLSFVVVQHSILYCCYCCVQVHGGAHLPHLQRALHHRGVRWVRQRDPLLDGKDPKGSLLRMVGIHTRRDGKGRRCCFVDGVECRRTCQLAARMI